MVEKVEYEEKEIIVWIYLKIEKETEVLEGIRMEKEKLDKNKNLM